MEIRQVENSYSRNLKDMDLSNIRGMQPPEDEAKTNRQRDLNAPFDESVAVVEEKEALEALAELVPGLKSGTAGPVAVKDNSNENFNQDSNQQTHQAFGFDTNDETAFLETNKAFQFRAFDGGDDENGHFNNSKHFSTIQNKPDKEEIDESSYSSDENDDVEEGNTGNQQAQVLATENNGSDSSSSRSTAARTASSGARDKKERGVNYDKGAEISRAQTKIHYDDGNTSENGIDVTLAPDHDNNFRGSDSYASQSTETQTHDHDVHIPLYLPTFKPATGCTNASDFIVRCFVARLRAGITVVKHGRSRWCKSRLRVLHVHTDGRSLSWKPAAGEPNSSKRPPKLDLSNCKEVRHAWSPDPLNPVFTGTPILRQKCEAANAHKSFALIFHKRTVDITAITADQCKVLMEGFSALCFRLQVAKLAGRKKTLADKEGILEEREDDRSTASPTLTNNSVGIIQANQSKKPMAGRTTKVISPHY
mmetsp:Transcript_17006/g.24069  ORF Transcript_17006/g.24069 Transcript_17006/m.24069 type:complete len:479 (+) Transcript_17006:77-1513(+)